MNKWIAGAAMAAAVASTFGGGAANAQQIVGATSATINSGGPGSGSINDTLNQNGLGSNYVSGVTDFKTYIASDPQHTTTFFGYEWFSNFRDSSASVTYDLGAIVGIDAVALWNEETSGIPDLGLYWSSDGSLFNLLGDFIPTDTPDAIGSYGPQVFSFTAVDARYIRFDISGCDGNHNLDCAIGEVAFRTAGAVPEPATWAMMLLGFGAVGFAMRRRKHITLGLIQTA